MSATVGKDGSFRVGATQVTFMDSWTLNTTLENADVTAYGDTAHKRVPTLRDWSVDGAGTLDRSDAEQAALLAQFENATLADIAIRLYVSAGSYWSGNALCASASIASKVGDKVGVTFNLVADGALSFTSS